MKKTWFTLAGLVPAMFFFLAFFACGSGPEPGSPALSPETMTFTIEGTTLVEYTGTSETPVIPWGITEIGNWAFWKSKITSVDIPASAIGHDAFAYSKLSSVNIPASVTTIGSGILLLTTKGTKRKTTAKDAKDGKRVF